LAVSARALGLLAGYLADRRLGDPQRRHPVAAFGVLATGLEGRIWADDRRTGVAYTSTLVGGATVLGIAAEHAARRRPLLRFLLTATATWAVLGSRSLTAEASAVRSLLRADDLGPARQRLTHLVGRDTSGLDASGISRAVVESVAENTSDAIVAPLLAGAAAGIPGLLAYRAANTLDAMVGHRSPRYVNFGWASARFDDLLNWLPARVSAGLAVMLAPTVGGDPGEAWRIWRRDAGSHPSPNAGQVEAAFAGALGVQLGGVNEYDGRIEDRHTLGDGPAPTPSDVDAANHLSTVVGAAAVLLAMVVSRRRPRRPMPQRPPDR
jgi:adenosylcobinamide-phosphate synthase